MKSGIYQNAVKMFSMLFEGNSRMLHKIPNFFCAGLMQPCWLEILGAEFSHGSVNDWRLLPIFLFSHEKIDLQKNSSTISGVKPAEQRELLHVHWIVDALVTMGEVTHKTQCFPLIIIFISVLLCVNNAYQ